MFNKYALGIFLLFAALPAAVSAWSLKKNESGIQIYTRPAKNSSIDEFKGEMIVNASLPGIIKLVQNMPACSQWIKYCKQGKFLKKESEKVTYTYTLTSLPWPMDNRDTVVKNTIEYYPENKGAKISFDGAPDFIPVAEGITRIRKVNGFWEFSKLENGSYKITYQVLSDPGNIPAWMVNMGIVDQPFETLRNMKVMLTKEAYK